MSTIIIDSGGTSSDWAVVGAGKAVVQFSTMGMNPVVADVKSIVQHAISEHKLSGVDQIYMYGAGCSTPALNQIVEDGLRQISNSATIKIDVDLLGAAYALCGHAHGVISILGTGSNTAIFDGKDFVATISSGGYLLGDEGSGFEIGKSLIIRYLRDEFSQTETSMIRQSLGASKNELINRVYAAERPNHLLASYASIFNLLSQETRDRILVPLFTNFIEKRLLPYGSHLDKGLFFCGSIAFHYQKELSAALNSVNLHALRIIPKPIEALIQFHTEYL